MERLLQLLNEKGITKADLARKLGVTPQVVGNYFNSDQIRPTTLASILRAIGWTPEQIADARLGDFYDVQPADAGNH